MNHYTQQTRREALQAVGISNESIVFDAIKHAGRPVGASEIAAILGWDINSVRPRLVALSDLQRITAVGKRKLPSGRHEATFTAITFEGNQGTLNLGGIS